MTCKTLQGKYAEKLETENKQLRIALQECRKALEEEIATKKKAIEYIKITIKIIKEQPSSCELNDIWTLEHLNSFLDILGGKENE